MMFYWSKGVLERFCKQLAWEMTRTLFHIKLCFNQDSSIYSGALKIAALIYKKLLSLHFHRVLKVLNWERIDVGDRPDFNKPLDCREIMYYLHGVCWLKSCTLIGFSFCIFYFNWELWIFPLSLSLLPPSFPLSLCLWKSFYQTSFPAVLLCLLQIENVNHLASYHLPTTPILQGCHSYSSTIHRAAV